MPVKLTQCVYKGSKGWAAEKGGHCFTGEDARKKAAEQVAAINISVAKKEGKQWAKKL